MRKTNPISRKNLKFDSDSGRNRESNFVCASFVQLQNGLQYLAAIGAASIARINCVFQAKLMLCQLFLSSA